ncbi:hypothetical protein IWW39_006168, partial [Coemansia spiralis]
MASILRNAKAGSDWTINELRAYNINVVNVDESEFFGRSIDDTINVPQVVFDDNSYFARYLDLAMALHESEESAVDDFAVELFNILGYRTGGRIIRTRKDISLFMCGEWTKAKTDVCIMNQLNILMLLQEDKSHLRRHDDPEPQLIAEAIAAFQHNNTVRVRTLNLEPLDSCVFPCVSMLGTYPTFYKIAVTAELDQAVQLGEYPENNTTVVHRFNPLLGGRRYNE